VFGMSLESLSVAEACHYDNRRRACLLAESGYTQAATPAGLAFTNLMPKRNCPMASNRLEPQARSQRNRIVPQAPKTTIMPSRTPVGNNIVDQPWPSHRPWMSTAKCRTGEKFITD